MTQLEKNGLNGTSSLYKQVDNTKSVPRAEIVCDGDSWVFGSEIVDPAIVAQHPPGTYVGYFDFEEENDAYRRTRVFSYHLQKYFDADITNLSWPADDNGSILRRTIDYISQKYLANNLSTENLFVMIGWSSPERNSFWYKDEQLSMLFRLWPNVPHFDSEEQKKFWEMYIAYLWHPEEYMTRYVHNVVQLQNFCNQHGIKWMCWNSFYQTPQAIHAANWEDLDVRKELEQLVGRNHGYQYQSTANPDRRDNKVFDYTALWDTVDPIRFYRKDQPKNTFKSYIQQPELAIDPVFWGWHPSPDAHAAWAQELARYIKDNNLL